MEHENCAICGTAECVTPEPTPEQTPEQTPEPTPTFNVEHGMRVLGHLLTYPEKHDQGLWFKQNCETTGCLAGWSCNLAGRTMVRTEPDNNTVDFVSLLAGENDVPADVTERYHYIPKPELIAAKATYARDLAAYGTAKAAYDAEWKKLVDDWDRSYRFSAPNEDQPLYPAYNPPDMPFLDSDNPENYTVKTLSVIPISIAARIDLGISGKMAGYLFAAHRTIGEITVVLGMLISGRSEESIFDGYIDDVRPSVEELQGMLAEGRRLNRDMNALLLRMGA